MRIAKGRGFPVEEKIPEIRRALGANRAVVLTAPPGSGKTTCVPPALMDEPWLGGRKIVVLEPRRLAARSCASYVSRMLGEEVGGVVGYQVRLERKVSARTRLEIVTEGLLAQRLLSDPELSDVGLVVFDEFHERALPCDLAFALALEVRRALRPDLRILVMSATLDADDVAAHLGDADVVRAEGRMFPVETRYLGDVSVQAAVSRAMEETDGDVLCFLPGEGEIRRAMDAIPTRPGCDVLPLYGSLPKDEQDRVFEPSPRRKVILSTSIAETSLTVEGVVAVVDSGLMRVPRFSPSTGMTGLVTLPLSLDRAEQRRGRAGRVKAGVCYRMWREADEASRPKRSAPEILDADLCGLVLASASWGALRRTDLPWMTPPPAAAWEQASGLLRLLGALDAHGAPTERGARMAKLPMHPRLANMVIASEASGVRAQADAALLAAIVEEGSRSRETDIRKMLDLVRETPSRPDSRRLLQLARRFCGRRGDVDVAAPQGPFVVAEGTVLARAYPDRVAKGRGGGGFRMVSGRGVRVDAADPLAKSEYLVCCSLDDRQGDARLFLGCPISEDEVEDVFAGHIVEEQVCEWDRVAERVKSVVRRRVGGLTLGERQQTASGDAAHSAAVAAAMVEGVKQKGVGNMPCWTKDALQLRARIAFVSRTLGGSWPAMTDEQMLAALPGFLSGMTKWRDLDRLDVAAVMDFILAESGHDRRELDRLAPARMEVPSGSHLLIHYDGDEPTVEARLQECFGLMETPKVAGGRVPVVMTLLSPAQRPIQVTKDLAGFWRGAYQLVRKDMRGRYPRHYWPEDPMTAVATRRVRPRTAT